MCFLLAFYHCHCESDSILMLAFSSKCCCQSVRMTADYFSWSWWNGISAVVTLSVNLQKLWSNIKSGSTASGPPAARPRVCRLCVDVAFTFYWFTRSCSVFRTVKSCLTIYTCVSLLTERIKVTQHSCDPVNEPSWIVLPSESLAATVEGALQTVCRQNNTKVSVQISDILFRLSRQSWTI